MYRAFPGADYYASSATPRRQQRTVRLPQTPTAGSAGTAGTLPTFTTDRSAGSVSSYTPGVSSRATATPRATLPARRGTRRDKTALNRYQDRAPQQPIAASFRAAALSRGF